MGIPPRGIIWALKKENLYCSAVSFPTNKWGPALHRLSRSSYCWKGWIWVLHCSFGTFTLWYSLRSEFIRIRAKSNFFLLSLSPKFSLPALGRCRAFHLLIIPQIKFRWTTLFLVLLILNVTWTLHDKMLEKILIISVGEQRHKFVQ